MNKQFYLVLIMACATLLTACKKEPEMPPQTQTGEEVLACKVDGVVHIYRGRGSHLNPDGVKYQRFVNGTDSSVRIGATGIKTYGDFLGITIHASNNFNIEIGKVYHYASETSRDGAHYEGYTTKMNAGTITFTRYDEKVASGTFSFTASDDDGSKVEITEGVFDIKNYYQ